MLRIKGFDKDLKCREMQFEVGKEYKIDSSKLELCTGTVFHYCKTLKQVHRYYLVTENNRYCYIEVLGEEIEDTDKCGSNHIKIVREILGEELDILLGRAGGNTGIFNTGNGNTGNRNIGNRNDGDFNTGDFNAGDGNTGYSNAGDGNTGDWNTGNRNTGDKNTGDSNTGDKNTGDFNPGYRNTGDGNAGKWNTGDSNTGYGNAGNFNTGDGNTGDFNSCHFSNGFFCSKEPKINIFNKKSKYTMSEFLQTEYYRVLHSAPFNLVKEQNEQTVVVEFKTACAEWWKK